MTTIKKLAEQMQEQFTTGKRDNGEEFHKLKDAHPEWMQDVCREAHSEMMPDDFIFEMISNAVDLLADVDDDCAEDFDAYHEKADELEADVYNNTLLKWVSSNLTRASYVDDALEAGATKLFDALQWGQLEERREVFSRVLEELRERAEGDEDGDSDEEWERMKLEAND